MYVVAGSDAAHLSMDEHFIGWYVWLFGSDETKISIYGQFETWIEYRIATKQPPENDSRNEKPVSYKHSKCSLSVISLNV